MRSSSPAPTTRWRRARRVSVRSPAGGIGAQLASGVRAFLIDLHYGARSAATSSAPTSAARPRRSWRRPTCQPSERAATEGVLALLGGVPPDERPTVYLCHLYCELGATPAVDAFRVIHDFLRENPNEVIVLVLEDYVEPADAVRCSSAAGSPGRRWRGSRASRCRRSAR